MLLFLSFCASHWSYHYAEYVVLIFIFIWCSNSSIFLDNALLLMIHVLTLIFFFSSQVFTKMHGYPLERYSNRYGILTIDFNTVKCRKRPQAFNVFFLDLSLFKSWSCKYKKLSVWYCNVTSLLLVQVEQVYDCYTISFRWTE